MALPRPNVKVNYWPLAGGLDLMTPNYQVDPGKLRFGINYESRLQGGYRRISGYAKFDSTAVPGSGAIVGVWYYNGAAYACRNATSVAGTTVTMSSSSGAGWATVKSGLTSSAGAKYDFVNYNFQGTTKMYGCSGAHKAFQWDGITWTDISTGMVPDTPRHITGHQKALFLSFGKSLQFSSVGDPTSWAVVTGAGEISTPDTITGMISAPGGNLVVLCRKDTLILSGTGPSDWLLTDFLEYGKHMGAVEWTVQGVGSHVHYLDDRGLLDLAPTFILSNFQESTLTYPIQPLIDSFKTQVTASVLVKSKSQYRLFSGKNFIILTFADQPQGGLHQLVGITQGWFPIPVNVACRNEDPNGNEIVLFGSDGTDGGYIYQMESGGSFDGAAIPASITTAFNNFKAPTQNKRFLKALIDMDAQTEETIRARWLIGYNNQGTIATDTTGGLALLLSEFEGGVFNVDHFNNCYFSATYGVEGELPLNGIASNIAFVIASKTTSPHNINGIAIHYSPRSLRR